MFARLWRWFGWDAGGEGGDPGGLVLGTPSIGLSIEGRPSLSVRIEGMPSIAVRVAGTPSLQEC